MLISDNVEVIDLLLPLIEQGGIEGGLSGRRKAGGLSRIVGNLIQRVRCAADAGQPALRIEHGGEIEEALFLLCPVANGFVRGCRVLDAEIVIELVARNIILGLSDRSAVLGGRRDGMMAAVIARDLI